jgi:hypothetical protein
MKPSKPNGPARPMTAEAARRIQSATAKSNGGQVTPRSFSARAQRAVSGKK